MTKLAVLLRTSFFILLAICVTNANANSQNQKVTISANSETLQKIFKEIKKQTGLVVFYSDALINDKEKITINVKEEALSLVLDKVIAGKPLKYEIQDKYIVISAKVAQATQNNPSPNENAAPPPANIDVVVTVVAAENNQTLEGASVIVKGSNKGVATDVNGRAVLKDLDPNATIVISYTGYSSQEIKLSGRNSVVVKLIASTNELEEVVINKGYYTEKKRFSVGNAATVKAVDIENQPVQNPLLALQGRIPGLIVSQTNGLPGGGATVRIQGQNSILSGKDPFIVIDGIPYFSQLPSTNADAILGTSGGMADFNSSGNPLNYINPSDIESIDVLKDGDATAIYGSRAANGAVLITTKKGKAGQMKFDLNMQTGWGQVTNKWNMLSTRQYLDMRYEALKNDGIDLNSQSSADANYYDLKAWDTTRYTDWQKVLIGGKAQYDNVSASISGGTNAMQYLISGNYHKETTVFPGDFNDQKGSMHFNISSSSPNQKFKILFTGRYANDNNRLLNVDLTRLAVQLVPVAPALRRPDGTLNWEPNNSGNSTWNNPLAELLIRYNNKTTNLGSSLQVSYEFFPGFAIKSSLGYNVLQTNDYSAIPLTYYRPEDRVFSLRYAIYGNRDLKSWIWEPQITYKRTINKGILDVLVGSTIQENNSRSGSISGTGYNNDEVLENMLAATKLIVGSQYNTQYKYNSIFGRVNYNLENKYIINLTGRRDGTSRFGPENQFQNFYSVGGGWIFTEERWMHKSSIVSFGKVRASYGTTGNDQIGDYKFLSLYNILSNNGILYQNSTGVSAARLTNPFLHWEETQKLQAGVDLGFFSDRILLNATYSRNRSSNQLLSYNLPSTTGFTGITNNLPATVQNTSWEFSLNTTNIKTDDFVWNSSINLTIPQNKLIAFPGLESSSYAGQLLIGQSLSAMYAFQFAGVESTSGLYQYYDSHGNITLAPNYNTDRNLLINTSPKFYGGFQNNFQFKGFELSFLLQFVKQLGTNYSFWNGSLMPGNFSLGEGNQPVTVLERWQKSDDNKSIALFTTGWPNLNTPSGNDYKDASYIRLKNLSLSYQLPESWRRKAQLKNVVLYLHAQNLFTITRWKGLDPETQSLSSLPPLRVITIGFKVGF